jgi:hypothetical protein
LSSRALKPHARRLYDEDFAAWSAATARLLRSRRWTEVDLEHLAEEVEDMGRSQARERSSRLRVLLAHLLKWQAQPQKRSRSWRATMDEQRTELRDLFRQSPSLRHQLEESLQEVYLDAVRAASIETGLATRAFPRECPFSVEQILDGDYLPE